MGAWGTGLYQDDIACDVRDYYIDCLREDDESAENKTLEYFEEEICDDEDGPVVWFALADTQWKYGRLSEMVKNRALEYIDNGINLQLWNEVDNKLYAKREKVLSDLKDKLLSPVPPKKKLRKPHVFTCSWNIGDVFAFQINNEKYHEHPLFHHWLVIQKTKVVSWYPHHIIPVITFRYSFETSCPSLSNLLTYPFIPIAKLYTKRDNRGKPIGDFFYDYQLGLVMTSKRNIPDTFVYLGNAPVTVPKNAYQRTNDDENYFYSKWLCIEEDILKKYDKFIIKK